MVRKLGGRVATVLLNYDNADDTLDALETIRRSTFLGQTLIVVDNNPSIAAQQALGDRLDGNVVHIVTGENIGYAAGNNIGIRAALEYSPEFVWILNPDIRVEPSTLEGLLNAADEVPDAGIVGGRILNANAKPQSIWFDGGIVDVTRFGATSHVNSGLDPATTVPRGIVDVDYVTGACMLVRSRAIEQVGFIPEDYFLYFEETDYCRRMQAVGWRTVVDQRVLLSHHKRSSGALPTAHYLYYMTRNRLLFAGQYFPSENSISDALNDFDAAFISPWRARVSERSASWLPVFDEIIESAIHDAHNGVRGKAKSLAEFPNSETDI